MGKVRNLKKNAKHNKLHATITPHIKFIPQTQHIVKRQMPYLNMMERFVETICQANDSGTFDTSFEVKHIVSPSLGVPKLMRHRCITELDRDKIEKFVRDFEERQMLNGNKNNYSNLNLQNNNNNNNNVIVTVEHEDAVNKSVEGTPKSSPYLYRKAKAIYQNSWIGSRNHSQRASTPEPLEIQRNTVSERASLRSAAKMLQFFAVKKNKSVTKTVTSTDDDDELDSSIDSSSPALSNSSAETSFEMHPPLVPTFKVTPPPITRSKRGNGSNPATEFARFLRGSFHAKRAAVTTLTRSISDSQHYHHVKTQTTNKQHSTYNKSSKNIHYTGDKKSRSTASSSMSSSQSSLSSPVPKAKSKALNFILIDTTNQQNNYQHSKQMQQKQQKPKGNAIRVSHF